ncbi:MAG: hypothetical protein HY741_08595 [Chloroflexi bacterium]|nr:hypothetical protein [Chloroflexota bacterium]
MSGKWIAMCVFAMIMIGCTAQNAVPATPPATATTKAGGDVTPTPTKTIADESPTAKIISTMNPTPVVSKGTASGTPAASAQSTPSAPMTGITARLNEPFTLKLGQWATLPDANDTRVSFTTLLEDTRCPLDVNCVQAGKVRVGVSVESGGKLAQFDLSSMPQDYRNVGAFNGYLVQFVEIAPARKTVNQPIPLGDYQLTLRVSAGSLDVAQARINEPFTLKLGQSVPLAGTDARVTFESVQQDSRCPARALCATSGAAEVVIAVQREDKTDRLTLSTNRDGAIKRSALFDTAGVALNALTPYPQNEFASKEIAPKEYQATLVVVNYVPSSSSTAPRITTTSVDACPDLTRGAASEILDEAVHEQPTEMILFPPPATTVSLHGICGYGSIAYNPNRIPQVTVPFVSPASVRSDRAVIAAKLTDQRRQEQLLSIVSALDAANPRGPSNLYMKLLTGYSAGAWSRDALGEFPDAARGAANVHVESVSGMGESAVWVWREFEGGRYAALVAQKGETLFVVTALTTAQRTKENVMAAMTTVMQKMLRN